MTREVRIGLAVIFALGAFVFFMLVVGSLGGTRPELQRIPVAEVLASGETLADRYGSEDRRIVGWYAELDADCVAEEEPVALQVPWLERSCPLRVLLPYQPTTDVTQAELSANGLRLAAPDGRPFPSRAQPGGANLRRQQLVYVGHFDDPAADECAEELVERCRNTFVVSDYDGLLR